MLVQRKSFLGMQRLSCLPMNLTPTVHSLSYGSGEEDMATLHTTWIWQLGREVNGGRGIIFGFEVEAKGFNKSVTTIDWSCLSEKKPHPWEAPTNADSSIALGYTFVGDVTNLYFDTSYNKTSPTFPPSGEGSTMMQTEA